MRWRNGRREWGAAARLLHWTVAALILIEVPAGLIMARTFGAKDAVRAAWQYWTSNFHHTAGLLILALAGVRLAWRLANPAPEPASPRPGGERWAARVTHGLLYALLLAVPLTGWAALSSLADSPLYGRTVLWFFGTNGFDGIVPRIAHPVAWDAATPFRYGRFAAAHRWLLIAGATVLALHVLAALRHHWLLRDDTLSRMLRSGRRDGAMRLPRRDMRERSGDDPPDG